MGEFLIVAPVNLKLISSIVVVVGCGGTVLQHLLIVDFLSLGEPGACGFPPSMIVLKESVVQVSVSLHCVFNLVKT